MVNVNALSWVVLLSVCSTMALRSVCYVIGILKVCSISGGYLGLSINAHKKAQRCSNRRNTQDLLSLNVAEDSNIRQEIRGLLFFSKDNQGLL
jgi:hypothetical protein